MRLTDNIWWFIRQDESKTLIPATTAAVEATARATDLIDLTVAVGSATHQDTVTSPEASTAPLDTDTSPEPDTTRLNPTLPATTPGVRATHVQVPATGTPARAQPRTPGHVSLQDLDPAARNRILALQRQLAEEIRPQDASKVQPAYLPCEDALLQALRLEGFGFGQIGRVR